MKDEDEEEFYGLGTEDDLVGDEDELDEEDDTERDF